MEVHDLKTKRFNVYSYLDVAETLAEADDPLLALKVLDSLPAYYRDFPPKEVVELRRFINSKIMVSRDYIVHKDDQGVDIDLSVTGINTIGRGVILKDHLKKANESGVIPHIIDHGPGQYWMAIGLAKEGLKFTYEPIGLENVALERAREIIGDYMVPGTGPEWYVAFEIIEHLLDVNELRITAERYNNVKKVWFSTPFYSFAGGNPRWKTEPIGHVRAYTPTEFINTIQAMFQGYKFSFAPGEVMTLIGEKP